MNRTARIQSIHLNFGTPFAYKRGSRAHNDLVRHHTSSFLLRASRPAPFFRRHSSELWRRKKDKENTQRRSLFVRPSFLR